MEKEGKPNNSSNANINLANKISTLEKELKIIKDKINSDCCKSANSSCKDKNADYYNELWKEVHKNFPE